MLVRGIYGGFVSQMKGFYMAYKLAVHKEDELILDVSSFYEGYKYPFFLDCFNVPICDKIAFRGDEAARIESMAQYYGQEICVIRNSSELEEICKQYDKGKIYYIIYDSEYDDFLYKYPEYSFLYVSNDMLTNKIMKMLELAPTHFSLLPDGEDLGRECVGVHIRLTDFVEIGWTVQEDLLFFPAAIQWMREHVSNARFYVFSDDICQAKNLLGYAEDIVYVEGDSKKEHGTDLEEFLLLASCRHKILTKKSTYSWFSAVVGRNKWNLNGYTLMIERLHVNVSQETREQIENEFNEFKGMFRKEDLTNCNFLSADEIRYWNARYERREKDICNVNGIKAEKQDSCLRYTTDRSFLFITYQVFSQWVIHGMQHMAKVVAAAGNRVYFVGTNIEYIDCREDYIDWTIQHGHEAFDDLNCSLGYEVFPYTQLNVRQSYKQFVEYISDRNENILYVIARKPCVFRDCDRSGNIKLIFVDFSDLYEQERNNMPLTEDVEYMYQAADLVITYKEEVYLGRKKELGEKIIFVDISQLYPAQKNFKYKLNNFREIHDVESMFYECVYKKIIDYFEG